MSRTLLFNKPYGVLTQFTSGEGQATLADYVSEPGVYPAGRLDLDSEGLVVLTDDGALQGCISHPRHKLPKTYWAQVEGVPDDEALAALRNGLDLGDFRTKPCRARIMDEPEGLWPRNPPIRFRKSIPTTWLEIVIAEGKNRQVRRMTAKIGHPTLRLIRWAIGEWSLQGLAPGEWRRMTKEEIPAELRTKPGDANVNPPARRRVVRRDAASRGPSQRSSSIATRKVKT